MQVSEIKFVPTKPLDGLIGFVSFVLDNSYYVGSVAIYTRLDGSGWRLVYPTKKLGERNLHYHHPINHKTNKAIEDAVLPHVQELLGN